MELCSTSACPATNWLIRMRGVQFSSTGFRTYASIPDPGGTGLATDPRLSEEHIRPNRLPVWRRALQSPDCRAIVERRRATLIKTAAGTRFQVREARCRQAAALTRSIRHAYFQALRIAVERGVEIPRDFACLSPIASGLLGRLAIHQFPFPSLGSPRSRRPFAMIRVIKFDSKTDSCSHGGDPKEPPQPAAQNSVSHSAHPTHPNPDRRVPPHTIHNVPPPIRKDA